MVYMFIKKDVALGVWPQLLLLILKRQKPLESILLSVVVHLKLHSTALNANKRELLKISDINIQLSLNKALSHYCLSGSLNIGSFADYGQSKDATYTE